MQGLIIAFIIIAFLYNVYKNFKKEAEQAEIRAKAAAKQQEALEKTSAVDSMQRSVYDRAVKMQEVTSSPPVFVTNKEDYHQEKRIKDQNRAAAKYKKKPDVDYYNPEIPVSEVIEKRRIPEPRKSEYKPVQRKKHIAANFNARQALVYDAIWRRPEY